MSENKAKVCKVCDEDKPIHEFLNKKSRGKDWYDPTCKLCTWLSKDNNKAKIKSITEWKINDLHIIVNSILNSDICYVNSLVLTVENKTLNDIVDVVSRLAIKGKRINIKYSCDVCGTESSSTISAYKKSTNHFCSANCNHEFKKNSYGAKEGHSICGICKKEKPIVEFMVQKRGDMLTYLRCKVCEFHYRNKDIVLLKNWSNTEYNIVLDLLLNKKVNYIDDILCYLENKNMEDVLRFINHIKLGNTKLQIKSTCGHCGKTFGIKPHLYKSGRSNYFCCLSCSSKFYGNIKTNNKVWYKTICKQCGIQYNIDATNINSGKRLSYCSTECSTESQKLRFRGKLNPNYKGGITQLYEYLRRGLLDWKKDSMKGCNYKCVLTGERFQAIHHVYSFQQIIEETLIETQITLKDEISDYTQDELLILYNKCLEIHYRYPLGVCLSRDLHELFHSIYSNKNNTLEQFEEFKTRYKNGEFNYLASS